MCRPARLAAVVAAWAFLLGSPVSALAGLAPHEVLVLVNARSPRSMEAANHFVHLRRVPARNVVYLDLPDRVLEPRAQISPEEFARTIWEPAHEALRERDLEDHVLAWVYSVDFPVRITSNPRMSLMGATFLRNQFPDDPDLITKAGYLSPLFAGPDQPDGQAAPGGSLINYNAVLGDRQPLPSMMMGFCGSRGTDIETVIRTLQYGQVSDRTAPRGNVYWITSDDIRSTMRDWQIPGVQAELKPLGIRTATGTDLAPDYPGIMGVQLGAADLDVARVGRHLPGSMAEHLTSHGAEFHLPIQTKMTDWLRAGATATAGTVTEPYSLWPKFPHARFFAHYARGHSMLESFYLSLRSPTQILLLGEPLARPWAPRLNLSLVAIEGENPFKGPASFMALVLPEWPQARLNYHLLVDGEHVSTSAQANTFSFDTRELADGYHELRAVSYLQGMLVHTATGLLPIEVNNRGRAARITAPARRAEVDVHDAVTFTAETDGNPIRLELVHNERVLASAAGDAASLTVAAAALGAGPVAVQLRALYDDDMAVHSAPLDFVVARRQPPPPLRALAANPHRREPDWSRVTLTGGSHTPRSADAHRLSPNATNAFDVCLFPDASVVLRNLSTSLTLSAGGTPHPASELAGIVFGYESDLHFNFFLVHGKHSAWSFGRFRNGQWEHPIERGALILRGTKQDVDLLFEGHTATAYVNGTLLGAWTHSDVARPGRIGLLTAARAAEFERVRLETVQSPEQPAELP